MVSGARPTKRLDEQAIGLQERRSYRQLSHPDCAVCREPKARKGNQRSLDPFRYISVPVVRVKPVKTIQYFVESRPE
jgi:hypothetical protein